MALVNEIESAKAYYIQDGMSSKLRVEAAGIVRLTGWSDFDLERVFVPIENKAEDDGYGWFEFTGESPVGIVGDGAFPAFAVVELPMDGVELKGIRIVSKTNGYDHPYEVEFGSTISAKTKIAQEVPSENSDGDEIVLFKGKLGHFNDSHQPTGTVRWDGWNPHFEFKKLSHTLSVEVTGLGLSHIKTCFETAVAAGAAAGIVSTYYGGFAAGLAAAQATFRKVLDLCLGAGFRIRFKDKSKWKYWYT